MTNTDWVSMLIVFITVGGISVFLFMQVYRLKKRLDKDIRHRLAINKIEKDLTDGR